VTEGTDHIGDYVVPAQGSDRVPNVYDAKKQNLKPGQLFTDPEFPPVI